MNNSLHTLAPFAQTLLQASMAWMDRYWDEDFGMLWASDDDPIPPGHERFHTVRGSLWYAVGLLMRQRNSDLTRALRILDKVLDYQFDHPELPFHGTFYRSPEEPFPPEHPLIWRSYDPNWREFIMSTYAVILLEYEGVLPEKLKQRIDAAFRKAIAGAIARGLSPGYTNIALMFAFVLCFAGQRLDEPNWITQGEAMAQQVYDLFAPNQTFDEYNSPTYYGVDLYALALWRCYPTVSAVLAPMGKLMEAQVWREAALFYHAGLRNFCGPYDRSYGMDATRYIAITGMWLGLTLGLDKAPLPDLSGTFDHQHDLTFGPLIALLGVEIPDDTLAAFTEFTGERRVTRTISTDPNRTITAWLSHDLMIGAEHMSHSLPRSNQLHVATLHWLPAGHTTLHWLRVRYRDKPIDAQATANDLVIDSEGEIAIELFAPGVNIAHIDKDLWLLPGLRIRVQCDARFFHFEPNEETLQIRYSSEVGKSIHLKIDFVRSPSKEPRL